jgi:xanthine dehydrogenase accessory factor
MELDWLETLGELQRSATPAVLVTVIEAKGSTPREAGAKMVVTRDGSFQTIGGGALEYEAIEEARKILAEGERNPAKRDYPLGPRLAQCCGGHVSVLLEPIWPITDTLVLFGAGHVGREVVKVMEGLAARILWVDERAAEFPAEISKGVSPVITAAPASEMRKAPVGAYLLVMTHSHDLDLDLVQAALERNDFKYLGLIGSASKRARFEKRLIAAGIPEERLPRLACPIGVDGITGKRPREIAVAAVAEMLRLGLGRGAP